MAEITRKEAIELIDKLMTTQTGNKSAWHFGYVELRVLLDAIYGPWKEGDPKL